MLNGSVDKNEQLPKNLVFLGNSILKWRVDIGEIMKRFGKTSNFYQNFYTAWRDQLPLAKYESLKLRNLVFSPFICLPETERSHQSVNVYLRGLIFYQIQSAFKNFGKK